MSGSNNNNREKKRKIDTPDDPQPPKKALDMIREKHKLGFHTPPQKGEKLHGVVITRISQDNILLGVTVEGGYKCREFLGRKLREPTLRLLAPFVVPPLERLPITGKYWKKSDAEGTVGGDLENTASYMISCTTSEPGSGSVLLYTVTKAQEELGDDVDFDQVVFTPIRRYFEHTKEPPVDSAILQDGPQNQIQTDAAAQAKWNSWPAWRFLVQDYALDSDAKVNAFVELSMLS